MLAIAFAIVFFSSRRRHTSWPRDWSSDVCSSDLEFLYSSDERFRPVNLYNAPDGTMYVVDMRSEERRVGKECRARWRREEEKKKMKETMWGLAEQEKGWVRERENDTGGGGERL